MNVLINAVAFKIAWVSTIFGGANELPMLGPLVILVAVSIHLFRSAEPHRELTLVVIAGFIGLVWDSIMVAAGWVSYASGTIIAGLAPYWIVAMWMLFATTLNITFRFLHTKFGLAVLLGGIFGPLSYFAGASAGAVTLNEPFIALSALSIAWAVLMPTLIWLARQLDGTQPAIVSSQV